MHGMRMRNVAFGVSLSLVGLAWWDVAKSNKMGWPSDAPKVKRMRVRDAILSVKLDMIFGFFVTTLLTNFLTFPFFEAINTFCSALPVSPSATGIIAGFVYTTATLPVTNYRYRKSMQLEVDRNSWYQAYPATLLRDVTYSVVRNYATTWVLGCSPHWKAADGHVMFIVVILACLVASPFNELRGYSLQPAGQEREFREFFRPVHCLRSTVIGSLKQSLSLGVGYWCAPSAGRLARAALASICPRLGARLGRVSP